MRQKQLERFINNYFPHIPGARSPPLNEMIEEIFANNGVGREKRFCAKLNMKGRGEK
jgi:hypothetical protein